MGGSGGSLRARATEKSISTSLVFEQDSLESTLTFFSSQVQVSLADDTGLAVALSWASKSARGDNTWLPSKEALVLDLREVL